MAVEIYEDRESWIKARKTIGLGASDAGTIIGVNPWKTNVALWEEKTGRREPEDISDKPYVQYGHQAEEHIRSLFALDHPELQVIYESPYKIIRSEEHPWLFCTPDGELEDSEGRHGGLEIKTTEIQNSGKWSDWDGRIPAQYYCQVLHQMLATGWEFVWLRAQIKFTSRDGEKRAETRDYYIDRKEVQGDLKYLLEAEKAFWEHVQNRTMPALILPEI